MIGCDSLIDDICRSNEEDGRKIDLNTRVLANTVLGFNTFMKTKRRMTLSFSWLIPTS